MALLTNDIYSSEKEWAIHASKSQDNLDSEIPVNGLFITMRDQDVSVAEAKVILKRKFLDLEGRFLQLREQLIKESARAGAPAQEVARFISSLELMVAGNLVFHLHSPRYQPDQKNPLCSFKPGDKLVDLPRLVCENSNTNGGTKSQSPVLMPETGSRRPSLQYITNGGSSKGMSKIEEVGLFQPDANLAVSSPWLFTYQRLPEGLILEPFDYVTSLPSKKIRKVAIEALDIWYQVPQQFLDIINSIIDTLHSSSLIIDDIEDDSALRRGYPATHMVFGTPQAINAANYLFVKCLNEVQKLPSSLSSPAASSPIAIFTDELRNLHTGQGLDLHWTFNTECPTEQEYIQMIDGKTGGLFRMAGRLMKSQATQNQDLDVDDLLTLMGRFFQIRDDYQNLRSADYSAAKGSLSDFDEGKYSFMLIHALNNTKNKQLKSLLQLRSKSANGLLAEQKSVMMKTLAQAKSMEYTLGVLEELQAEVEKKMEEIETAICLGQKKNWILRAIMARLRIADPKLRYFRV
ncbi:Dimethylallyltranstransferase [Dactylellina cionopaga]|nr:Dimethylallyltranstransferase [Dactylellina cionopaga]